MLTENLLLALRRLDLFQERPHRVLREYDLGDPSLQILKLLQMIKLILVRLWLDLGSTRFLSAAQWQLLRLRHQLSLFDLINALILLLINGFQDSLVLTQALWTVSRPIFNFAALEMLNLRKFPRIRIIIRLLKHGRMIILPDGPQPCRWIQSIINLDIDRLQPQLLLGILICSSISDYIFIKFARAWSRPQERRCSYDFLWWRMLPQEKVLLQILGVWTLCHGGLAALPVWSRSRTSLVLLDVLVSRKIWIFWLYFRANALQLLFCHDNYI